MVYGAKAKKGGEPRAGISLSSKRPKLDEAKKLLIMIMPHFLPLLEVSEKRQKISVSEDIETARTYPDGRILFGKEFLAKLSVEETAFIIAHELGHHYMATFSREKAINDRKMHKLTNIASDVQINNMVAEYFEVHNYKDIRKLPYICDGQWWERDRIWYNNCICRNPRQKIPQGKGDKISLEQKQQAEYYSLTLEQLSRKFLPENKFKEINDLSMEDIVAALEIFDTRAESESLQIMLKECFLKGRIKCKRSKAFPVYIIIKDTHIKPEQDPDTKKYKMIFRISQSDVQMISYLFTDIIPELTMHLVIAQGGSSEQRKLEIPLKFEIAKIIHDQNDISEQELKDNPPKEFRCPGSTTFTIHQDLNDYDLNCKLIGNIAVSYEYIFLKLDGEIELQMTSIADGSGNAPADDEHGSGHRRGDLGTRDELKKRYPGMTDADIDKAVAEMDEACKVASGMVVGNGTSLDMAVREGLYRVPWQAFLQNWLDGHSRVTRTYNRASRRGELDDPRCCLPGRARVGYRLNIVLDTSGSMIDRLPSALGAISNFCERNAVDCIKIVECDAAVQDIKEITPDELRRYSIKGTGGTDMTPGMIAFENDPTATAVIVVTDGEIGDGYPQRRMPYDVLWCLVGAKRYISVKYGKQIHI